MHIHPENTPGGLGESITGFVENFTFSHVVIRAFDCKQVRISCHHTRAWTYSHPPATRLLMRREQGLRQGLRQGLCVMGAAMGAGPKLLMRRGQGP